MDVVNSGLGGTGRFVFHHDKRLLMSTGGAGECFLLKLWREHDRLNKFKPQLASAKFAMAGGRRLDEGAHEMSIQWRRRFGERKWPRTCRLGSGTALIKITHPAFSPAGTPRCA